MSEIKNQEWISELLAALEFVNWDRFVVTKMNDTQYIDIYGWIDRDDEYKDFVWTRFWPVNETVEYTTSSDEYSKEITRIWFGEDAVEGHNACERVEHTFEIENSIELDD